MLCFFPYPSALLLAAQQKPRDSSVEVRSDWEVKEEMDFPRLMKMRYLEVSEPEDMYVHKIAGIWGYNLYMWEGVGF